MTKKYSPTTQRVLKQARKDTRSIKGLKDAQGLTEAEATANASRADWANPDNLDEWIDLQEEAGKLEGKAQEHPFPMAQLLQAAVREHGMPKKKSPGTLMRKKAAKEFLERLSRRR